jgi:hypothetical protein
MEEKLCKCGCGNFIPSSRWHKYRGLPNYIRGHHFRCLSPETLKKKSSAAKKRTDEGRNNNFIGCMRGRHKTDEQRKKQSEAMKGKKSGIKRPEHRAKMIEIARKNEMWGLKNPELRAIAIEKRPPLIGEKNGHYIDGRTSKPGYAAALESKKRARKFNQTPPDADHKKIALYYETAKTLTILTGEQYDVDHIIPLQGENVSGLHVPSNLQVITCFENVAKNNSWNWETQNWK